MTLGSSAPIQVSNHSQLEYESVHTSRVRTRALRVREHPGGVEPQNRAQLQPAKKTQFAQIDGVVTDASVIGRGTKKHFLKNS